MSEPVKRLRDYLIVGVVVYLVGTVVMVLAWPHTTVGTFGGVRDSGSMPFAVLGALGASVGVGVCLVALIGLGVKFGREAAELD